MWHGNGNLDKAIDLLDVAGHLIAHERRHHLENLGEWPKYKKGGEYPYIISDSIGCQLNISVLVSITIS